MNTEDNERLTPASKAVLAALGGLGVADDELVTVLRNCLANITEALSEEVEVDGAYLDLLRHTVWFNFERRSDTLGVDTLGGWGSKFPATAELGCAPAVDREDLVQLVGELRFLRSALAAPGVRVATLVGDDDLGVPVGDVPVTVVDGAAPAKATRPRKRRRRGGQTVRCFVGREYASLGVDRLRVEGLVDSVLEHAAVAEAKGVDLKFKVYQAKGSVEYA